MTYTPTRLIARDGYSGMGATSSAVPSTLRQIPIPRSARRAHDLAKVRARIQGRQALAGQTLEYAQLNALVPDKQPRPHGRLGMGAYAPTRSDRAGGTAYAAQLRQIPRPASMGDFSAVRNYNTGGTAYGPFTDKLPGLHEMSDYIEMGDVSGDVSSAASSILGVFTGAANAAGQATADKSIYAANAATAMPTWVMPIVLIGGLGLVAVMLSNKKKAAAAARARAAAAAAPKP